MQKHKSFTLIEMLIVVVIIGILAAALIPKIQSVQGRARNVQRKVDLSTINKGIDIFYMDNNQFPIHLGILESKNILTSVPKDPQVAINNPCAVYYSYFTLIYQPVGFYTEGSNPTLSGIAYNGYLYEYRQKNKTAWLATRMENDGTYNSHDMMNGADPGAAMMCGYGGQLSSYDNDGLGPYMVGRIGGVVSKGTTSKGELFIQVVQK